MMPPPRRPLLTAAFLVAAGCAPGCTGPASTIGPLPHAATHPNHNTENNAASSPINTEESGTSAAEAERLDLTIAPPVPRVLPPAGGYGWRLALPAIDESPSLGVEIKPGRRSPLRIGTTNTASARPSAAQPEVRAVEPAPDAQPKSPRHAVLSFLTPARADNGLVALVAHVKPHGRPTPGGFCLEIRDGASGKANHYAFEHPAARLILTTSTGVPLAGGRDDPARAAHQVRMWPPADREAANADISLVARFGDDDANAAHNNATLRAWFRSETSDNMFTGRLTATDRQPSRRLLVVHREPGTSATPFITVYETPTPGAQPIRAVTTRLFNRGQTRVVTVATDTAVHTLVQHLLAEPYITPDFSLDGRFAAITRTADNTLIDAYLGDGNALVLPEMTLDAQTGGHTSAYARP